jgi:hypothetical protein
VPYELACWRGEGRGIGKDVMQHMSPVFTASLPLTLSPFDPLSLSVGIFYLAVSQSLALVPPSALVPPLPPPLSSSLQRAFTWQQQWARGRGHLESWSRIRGCKPNRKRPLQQETRARGAYPLSLAGQLGPCTAVRTPWSRDQSSHAVEIFPFFPPTLHHPLRVRVMFHP